MSTGSAALLMLLVGAAIAFFYFANRGAKFSGPAHISGNDGDPVVAQVIALQRTYQNHPILMMDYADADGIITRRAVAVLHIDIAGRRAQAISAWCGLRNGQRMFRIDRMLEVWDATGTPSRIADPATYLMRFSRRGL